MKNLLKPPKTSVIDLNALESDNNSSAQAKMSLLGARAKMKPAELGSKHIYAREHKLYCFIT